MEFDKKEILALSIIITAAIAIGYFIIFVPDSRDPVCQCDGCVLSFVNPDTVTGWSNETRVNRISCCYDAKIDETGRCVKYMQISECGAITIEQW